MHAVIRRAVGLLSASYALAWASVAMTAGPGPSAFVQLQGDARWAGLFFGLWSLAAAAGAALGGRAMDRAGRRPILVGAHVLTASGYAVVGAGVIARSLAIFVAGVLLLAFGMGVVYLTRLAAAECFPASRRARGMAWTLLGAAGGALLGPLLLVASSPFAGGGAIVWFVAAAPPLVAGALVALAPETSAIARDLPRYHPAEPATPARPARTAAPARRLLAAIAALAAAQAAMVGVMGVAGVHLGAHGAPVTTMALVLALHFVGMFALSPVVGAISDRVGRRATILAGLALLATGALVLGLLPGNVAFGAGLFLVGLGWSFAYVGASVLVTDVTPAPRRARMLGRLDLAASLLAGAGAILGGLWYGQYGIAALGIAAAALVALPVAALALAGDGAAGDDASPVA